MPRPLSLAFGASAAAHRTRNNSAPGSHENRAAASPTRSGRTTAHCRYTASGLQLPTLELLPSRPEVAEMVNRRPRRRERERLELLVHHLLQVVLAGDADRHVRVELLASFVRHERRHVVDGRLVDVGV